MKRIIAEHLLNIGAVHLRADDPFTWTSGLKAPIYCDNRLTLSYPNVRRDIIKGFVELTKDVRADVVAGTATAGIPHAALLSDQLDLPMIYVRSSAKGHGKKNQIEGKLTEGDRVILVEDLISTGGSVLQAAEALQKAGAIIEVIVAIFTYEFPRADEAFQKANIPVKVLTSYSTLLEVAKEKGMITSEEERRLALWRQDPTSDAWMK